MRKFFTAAALCLALLFAGSGMSEAATAVQAPVATRLCGVNLGTLPWWWSCYITGSCRWC